MAQPNVILITASGLRWDAMGCAGHPDVRTPNLDALAANGLRFDQAVCTSTSAQDSALSLLTGRRPKNAGPEVAEAALPWQLRNAGYETAFFGMPPADGAPEQLGFGHAQCVRGAASPDCADDYATWLADQGTSNATRTWYAEPASAPAAFRQSLTALRSPLDARLHSTAWIGGHAVRFLQTATQPFFLWVSFDKPEPPFDAPAPWGNAYAPRSLAIPAGFGVQDPAEEVRVMPAPFDAPALTEGRLRRVLAYYYGLTSFVDQQVGRLLATMSSRAITNNLVVFTADSGQYLGHHGLLLERSARPYDPIIRVPLIVAGIPRQRRNATDAAVVELTDVAPTVLDAIGRDPLPGTEGISLLPLFRQAGSFPRAAAVIDGPGKDRCVRGARYKLIAPEDADFRAFYDLVADPEERQNRYGDPAVTDAQASLDAVLTEK